jgi:hypothetical protein
MARKPRPQRVVFDAASVAASVGSLNKLVHNAAASLSLSLPNLLSKFASSSRIFASYPPLPRFPGFLVHGIFTSLLLLRGPTVSYTLFPLENEIPEFKFHQPRNSIYIQGIEVKY